ncbi:peptidase M61 [Robertkochia marina]|uniref:Peptidase M61 n=1 Tax=Robertkochia marina TaxID=1227945 RepID=A0A4S3LWW7_9FLAO|nr:peptidase M61 [Robertkochia marina]THD65655.1 peptidase M61 [Robertkochia marina]TRZ46664.1 peptidase M61 [Robertkochia marina]
MNKFFFMIPAIMILSCSPKFNDMADDVPVKAIVDLVNVSNDRIKVGIDPGRFSTETVVFMIPKTVPGTYSIDNYGQYTEELKAFDYNGNTLPVSQAGPNQWEISNGKELDRIEYYVNDTFDSEWEMEEPVFSPAGTNIEEGKNYFLNLHMIIGYFEGLDRQPYSITFQKPAEFVATTSLTAVESPKNNDPTRDQFYATRYFEVTDNPVMYAKPDLETFTIDDIEVTLSVYSPNNVYSALSLKREMELMMRAQKSFLGDLNTTEKYNILLYLSDISETSPKGFGALEHHTSTTVVLPETMAKEDLMESMIDVVAHEFFHIVTPLSIHSEEVHYFNYNNPEMSQHLWMYEGVTEYFAQLFQINQGLISEARFYEKIHEKISFAERYDDTMSFTTMSANILDDPYKENYANVYQKGALIGMCIDIIIREQSNGERGILDLMKALAAEYGTEQPFKDDKLFDKITALTYPEVEAFINTHVKGGEPIPYEVYLNKVGLSLTDVVVTTPSYLFKTYEIPFIDAKPTGEIFVREMPLGSFFTELGLESGDIIKSINGTEYTLENSQDMLVKSIRWKEGDAISIGIERDGELMTIEGTVAPPVIQEKRIITMETPTPEMDALREAWLKG